MSAFESLMQAALTAADKRQVFLLSTCFPPAFHARFHAGGFVFCEADPHRSRFRRRNKEGEV
jgi:hypothetical protein